MKTENRLTGFLKRLVRKSATFRNVWYNISGAPSWSSNDIVTFVKEGYGNPYVYAALDYIVTAMSEAPPILYRVRGGSKIERSHEEAYNLKSSLRGRSSKGWSKSQAAEQVIKHHTAQYTNILGCNPAIGRRLAMKALVADKEIEQIFSHPALDLLHRPNGYYQTNYTEFVQAYGLSMLIAGEAFTEPIGDGEPTALFVLPISNVQSLRATEGNPLPGFKFGNKTVLKYSPDPLDTEVFFAKDYDPLNPLRGLSPMNAAIRSIDLNNSAREFNFNFMKNSGMPPAMITGEFKEDAGAAIEDSYEQKTGGSKNAGRIFTLGGKNLKYHKLSTDDANLKWIDTLKMSAREIAIVWKVSPELLGDSATKTFANFAEARLSLYQDNALPKTDAMYQHWNQTWLKRFGDDLILDYDADQVIAIADDIAKVYERISDIDWLTFNEKRTATNWPPLEQGGDTIYIPLNLIPLEVAGQPPATEAEKAKGQKLLESLSGDGAPDPHTVSITE